MISVYDLKSRFQNILRPICMKLANAGVSANQITILAILLSVIYGALLCLNYSIVWLLLPLFLFVRMALNAIDGMLAREHNMKSNLGMALNELGDIISDTALFIPFIFVAPQASVAIGAFIIAAILTEFCGVLAYMISGARRYDGPMGKSDRAAVTGILGLTIGLGFTLNTAMTCIFATLALLCMWSCLKRLQSALSN